MTGHACPLSECDCGFVERGACESVEKESDERQQLDDLVFLQRRSSSHGDGDRRHTLDGPVVRTHNGGRHNGGRHSGGRGGHVVHQILCVVNNCLHCLSIPCVSNGHHHFTARRGGGGCGGGGGGRRRRSSRRTPQHDPARLSFEHQPTMNQLKNVFHHFYLIFLSRP